MSGCLVVSTALVLIHFEGDCRVLHGTQPDAPCHVPCHRLMAGSTEDWQMSELGLTAKSLPGNLKRNSNAGLTWNERTTVHWDCCDCWTVAFFGLELCLLKGWAHAKSSKSSRPWSPTTRLLALSNVGGGWISSLNDRFQLPTLKRGRTSSKLTRTIYIRTMKWGPEPSWTYIYLCGEYFSHQQSENVWTRLDQAAGLEPPPCLDVGAFRACAWGTAMSMGMGLSVKPWGHKRGELLEHARTI